jgi:hypothetical protein
VALATIPLLIFLGLPPHNAIATCRFATVGLTGSGLYEFNKLKKVNWKKGIPLAAVAVIGTFIGANTLLLVPGELLEKLIGVLVLGSLFLILFNKNIGVKRFQTSKLKNYLGFAAFFGVGFWGGFFGGGTTIMSSYVLIFLFGHTFLESAGTRKIILLSIGILASIVYYFNGLIDWTYAIVLFAAMRSGAYFGTKFGVKKGDEFVRILFFIIVLVLAIKLLFF